MLWSLASWRNCEVWSAKCLFEKVVEIGHYPSVLAGNTSGRFTNRWWNFNDVFTFHPEKLEKWSNITDWYCSNWVGSTTNIDRCLQDDSKGIPNRRAEELLLAENAFKRRWSNLIAIPMSFYVWCTTCHININWHWTFCTSDHTELFFLCLWIYEFLNKSSELDKSLIVPYSQSPVKFGGALNVTC